MGAQGTNSVADIDVFDAREHHNVADCGGLDLCTSNTGELINCSDLSRTV